MYDLNEILNNEEIVKLNNKEYKIRELKLKERASLEKILREYVAYLTSLTNTPDALVKDIGTKDSTDFKFIKTALDFCNPGNPFTLEDFEQMTTSQVKKLQEIIFKINGFFDAGLPATARVEVAEQNEPEKAKL